MPDQYDSPSYDGAHNLFSTNDWRGVDRVVGYGNWSGPGNRMDHDPNFKANSAAHATNSVDSSGKPIYDPYLDQELLARPEHRRIDGLDEAAFQHDHGYFKDLGDERGENMFTIQGMHNVREHDRELVRATQAEFDQNGDRYSSSAMRYSEGLRGYFGTRVAMQDGAEWVGDRAGEAGQGISNFVDGARNWNGVGDAASGLAHGAMDAGRWGLNTVGNGVSRFASRAYELGFDGGIPAMMHAGHQAADWTGRKAGQVSNGISNFVDGARNWDGVGDAASGLAHGAMDAGRWGLNTLREGVSGVRDGVSDMVTGKLSRMAGIAGGAINYGLAAGWEGLKGVGNGAAWLGGKAMDGARSVGTSVVNGVSNVAHGAARVAGQAWDGAKSVGSSVVNGVSRAASATGTAISNGASAVGRGVSSAARAVGNGVSSAASAVGRGVSSAASAVGNGVSSAAGAMGRGVSSAASAVGNGVSSAAGAVSRGASSLWHMFAG